MADVRVGIVAWRSADVLKRCLAALPAALEGVAAEVVVVDNDSPEGDAEVAARHGCTVIRNPRNAGYARAMNQALVGEEEVLIALNPDTCPPPGSLATLVERLQAQPDVGMVVPRLCNQDGTLQRSVQRFPSLRLAAVAGFVPPRWQRGRLGRRWWLEGAPTHDVATDIDWAIGAVDVIRRAALRGAAPFSERWFMYGEDMELCWRLRRDGWRVRLEADVEVPHVGNASGEKAWGWQRARRYWSVSYDLDALLHGRRHAQAYALLNATSTAAHLVANQAGRLAGGPAAERRRHAAGQLRAVLPVHVRAALHGPPPPDDLAPAPTGPPPSGVPEQ